MSNKTFKVATRGSELALHQTQLAIGAIKQLSHNAEEFIIKTKGDQDHRPFSQIAGDGFFTKELERSLLSGEATFAVHSSKDLPSMIHENLPWMAFSRREDNRDLLIAKVSCLSESGPMLLKPGTRIGTSSPRRQKQIEQYLPGCEITTLRGNVPTRIQKVKSGELDAIILAAAGVNRLGLLEGLKSEGLFIHHLDWVTAPCQGVIAVQSTQENRKLLEQIANSELDLVAKAEKSMLALLGGGCHLPLGVEIKKVSSGYTLRAFLGREGSSFEWAKEGPRLGDLQRDFVVGLAGADYTDKRVWLAQPLQHILKPARVAGKLGLTPIAWPLVEPTPCWKSEDVSQFFREREKYGAVSFSSQMAVQIFITECSSYFDVIDWLKKRTVFSVGPATSQKLISYGLRQPLEPAAAHGSSLARLIEGTKFRGDLLIPGQAGSIVKSRLRGLSQQQKSLVLYRMKSAQTPMGQEVPEVKKNDTLVLTSPSSAKEYVLRCQKNVALKTLKVWAFGPSTSKELVFLGVPHKTNPVSGSWEACLEEIKKGL